MDGTIKLYKQMVTAVCESIEMLKHTGLEAKEAADLAFKLSPCFHTVTEEKYCEEGDEWKHGKGDDDDNG